MNKIIVAVVLTIFPSMAIAQERVAVNPVPDDDKRVVISDPKILWADELRAADANSDIHTPIGKIQDISDKLDKLAQNGGVDQNAIAESVAGRVKEQIKNDVADLARTAAQEAVKGATDQAAVSGWRIALWGGFGALIALFFVAIVKGLFGFVGKFGAAFTAVVKTMQDQSNTETK